MTDKTTKVLLFSIAIALWANLLGGLGSTADAEQIDPERAAIMRRLQSQWDDKDFRNAVVGAAEDIHAIATGMCLNRKLC